MQREMQKGKEGRYRGECREARMQWKVLSLLQSTVGDCLHLSRLYNPASAIHLRVSKASTMCGVMP